jgi:purine-cytosine permease-like protein
MSTSSLSATSAQAAAASPAPSGSPSATTVETFGVDPIPHAHRDASVFDFLRVQWGGANTLATAVLGAFPIIFGLSFWHAALATVLGVALGALILAPMSVFGPITGTNNAVSSGAHFGVVGRVVGSFLSLLTAIAFFSISVWSSGDAFVGTLHRLFGLTESDGLYAFAYALFASGVLVVCLYGFKFMLLVNKIAVAAATPLFILGFIAFAPDFDASFAGTASLNPGTPGFWAAFIGSALIVLSNPISFGAFLGDWSRYVPHTTPPHKLILATLGGQLLTLVPFFFGLVTTSIIAVKAPDYLANANYTGGLLAITHGWFFTPLLLLALVGGMSTGTTSLYGTGLDFSSVFPQLSRVRATLLVGVLAIALIFAGRFAFNLVASITTFVTLIIVMTTPWMVIMVIGLFTRRGHYLPDDLQVFTRRQKGGAYWFYKGWNLRGMVAWLPSALIALSTVNIPGQFVGWFGELAGGVDISLLVALALPAVVYPVLLWCFPEPRGVFGPQGPQGVPCAQIPTAPIEAE